MLLVGPGIDPPGRTWVEANLPDGHLAVAPPGVFVCDAEGSRIAHLEYRTPPETWLTVLGALVGGASREWSHARPELLSVEAALRSGLTQGLRRTLTGWLERNPHESGAAWAKLLLGVEAYRSGDISTAHAHWRSVLHDHPHHPLAHRARYHLYDGETWPTRLHPDLAGAPSLLPTPAPSPTTDGATSPSLPRPLRMVSIPAGTFTMGGSPAFLSRELPTRRVTITQPFAMSDTVVTCAQWAEFDGLPVEHPNLPKTGISFRTAHRFCDWLSRRDNATYRLPTEAEWEWAARGGIDGAVYPWGDEAITPAHCNYLGPRPVRVASYPPNAYGLFDMVGNVQEWTSDFFREHAYAEQGPTATDPQGPPSADQGLPLRVVRGGQCGAPVIQLFCRNSFRLGLFEEYSGGSIGLRLVRELS